MKMNYLKSPCLLCLIFFLSHLSILAQPVIAGADISYSATSTPGIVEVTLGIVRPCNTIALCSGSCGSACDQTIEVWGAENGYSGTLFSSFTLSLTQVYDVGTNQQCFKPEYKNTCDNMGCVIPGTYSPSYEQYLFKGLVNIGSTSSIPSNCCMIRLVWDDGVRDNNIQTIQTPQSFYTDATLNRCLTNSTNNSSPILYNTAVATTCAGENYIHNLGMIDPDYDSLTFAFAPALAAYNTPVTYEAPYAYNKPMPWIGNASAEFPGGIRCDPETGDVMFTPGNSGSSNITGVVVIECKEWKRINGVNTVIGITRRDMNLTVLANCPSNNPPRLVTIPFDGINPHAPKMHWEFCSGRQGCFTVTAVDTDYFPPIFSDTSFLTWNAALAPLGATFKTMYDPTQRGVSGPREDTYQFCWTPDDSLVSRTPYYFTIQAQDSRCPNAGRISRSFSIQVNQGLKFIDTVSIVKTDSGCGRYYLNVENTVHQNSPNIKQLRIGNKPNDPTFTMGFVGYHNWNNQMHIFNDTGIYYIQCLEEDSSLVPSTCVRRFEHLDSIHISETHQIQDSVSIIQPTCSNKGTIEVFATNPQYTFALNDLKFGTQTKFDSLLPNTYSLYVQDNTSGCIKGHSIMLNPLPRLIQNITTNNPSWQPQDTVMYTVNLLQPSTLTYNWTVELGNLISGQGTSTIQVIWGNLSGMGLVNVTVADQNCIDSAQFETYWLTSGLANPITKSNVYLYPNPTTGIVNIQAPSIKDETVQVFDIHGKLLINENATSSIQLDLSHYPKGIYLIKIGSWKGKVVKGE